MGSTKVTVATTKGQIHKSSFRGMSFVSKIKLNFAIHSYTNINCYNLCHMMTVGKLHVLR